MCPDILTTANTFMLDWNLLITVLAGLGGVAVGGFVTWKIQDRQLKHIDENRFQEERMETYTEFLSEAHTLFAANKLLAEKKASNEDIIRHHKKTQVSALTEVNILIKKISIIATEKTYLLAKDLYTLVTDGVDSEEVIQNSNYKTIERSLEIAVRTELKIDINT